MAGELRLERIETVSHFHCHDRPKGRTPAEMLEATIPPCDLHRIVSVMEMTATRTACDGCEGCPASKLVCRCLKVTEQTLVDAIDGLGLTSLREVINHTGAGDGCTACHRRLKGYLNTFSYSSSSEPICSVK